MYSCLQGLIASVLLLIAAGLPCPAARVLVEMDGRQALPAIDPTLVPTDQQTLRLSPDKAAIRTIKSSELKPAWPHPKGSSAPRRYVLEYAGLAAPATVAAAAAGLPGVRCAEPDFSYAACSIPNDPLFPQENAAFSAVGFPAAWDVRTGSAAVTVAVLDSGIDADHADLQGILAPGGFNFPLNNTDVRDRQGHGTRIAGLIAAPANNGLGIAGAAYGVRILPLVVTRADGSILNSDVVLALDYAVAQGARVINMSFAAATRSDILADALRRAAASAVLVAAVGNDGRNDRPMYPAGYPEVIGVAATQPDGTRAPFSNFNGPGLELADLAAPGVDIFSTIPGDQYDGLGGTGTSYAAPLAAAAAALLASAHPAQSATALTRQLLATADPSARSFTTWGRLDAAAALATPLQPEFALAVARVLDAPRAGTPNDGDGVPDAGEHIRLAVDVTSRRGDGLNVSASLSSLAGPISTAGGSTSVSIGTVVSGLTASNSAQPFGEFIVNSISSAARARFQLRLTADNAQPENLNFELPVEVETNLSGIQNSYPFTSATTYRVNANLLLRGATTIPAGTRIKVDPGVDIQLRTGTALTAAGRADAPITITGALSESPNRSHANFAGNVGPLTTSVSLETFQHVLYVSVSGGSDAAGDGTRENPYASLAKALSQAGGGSRSNRFAILVAGGTYREPTVRPKSFVSIYGGFDAATWQRDIARTPTVLDGENIRRVFSDQLGQADFQLDGVCIYRSRLAVVFNQTTRTLSNCVVNTVVEETLGAVVCGGFNIHLQNLLVMDNQIPAPTQAGGILFVQEQPELKQSIILNNSGGLGGAMLVRTGARIEGNLIVGNQALSGGALAVSNDASATPVICNNIFLANVATGAGGAIYKDRSERSISLQNNTILDNVSGSGATISWLGTLELTNNIIRGNAAPTQLTGVITAKNNNIQGDYGAPADNNIDLDPRFVGLLDWGVVTSAVFRPELLQTELVTPRTRPAGQMRNQLVRFGGKYQVVADNVGDRIFLWGDATAHGTLPLPERWELFDYHLRADSPCRGAGQGPAVNANIPLTDVEGDVRAGATTDLGVDQYAAQTATASPAWGRFWITSQAQSAQLNHVRFEGGAGVLNDIAGTNIGACVFDRSTSHGLNSTAALASLTDSTATLNLGSGFTGTDIHARGSVADYNFLDGFNVAEVSAGVARSNLANGIRAGQAEQSLAQNNAAAGFVLSGTSANLTARANRGAGIVQSAGELTSATAESNGGWGIDLSGSGAIVDALSQLNAGGGIRTTGNSILTCEIRNNTGAGIESSGLALTSGTIIANNSGPALTRVAQVIDSIIVGNGGGLDQVNLLRGGYLAGNTGDGIRNGTINDSVVLNNTGDGLRNPTAVTNVALIGNTGWGIRSDATVADVTSATIAQNRTGGVMNLRSLQQSNLLANSGYAVAHTLPGALDFDYTGNYWGSLNHFIDRSTSESNLSFIRDVLDGGSDNLVVFYPAAPQLLTNTPSSAAPGFLQQVLPGPGTPVNAGLTTFTLRFSEEMNTLITPTVTFGLQSPYTEHVITASSSGINGWSDERTWKGTFPVFVETGDGTQTLRVAGASTADGFTIPDDTRFSFVIDTAGGTVANNGIATITGGKMSLYWESSAQPGIAGYNVLRAVLNDPDSEFRQVNSTLIPAQPNFGFNSILFFDPTANIYEVYIWRIMRVYQNSNTVDYTDTFVNKRYVNAADSSWVLLN